MRIVLRLVRFALKYRRRLALAYLCLLGSTLFALAIPRLLGTAIDTAITAGVRSHLLWLALGILGVSLFRGAFSYGQSYLGEWISQRVAYDLRNAFYDKLQRLSFAYHDTQQTGNLMSKATADVEGIRWFINMGLLRSAQLVVMVAAVALLLLTTNWKLGLISMAFVPILAWRAIVVSTALRGIWTRVQESLGHLITLLQENLSGVRVVKAFAAEEYEREKFNRQAAVVARETYLSSRLHSSNSALMTFVFTLAMGVILWYGGRLVIAGELTHGELAQFIFYMGMLVMPVRMTGWMVNTFSRAASAGRRIFEVLDAPSPVQEMPGARPLGQVRGEVRLEGVSFHYDGTEEVLHHIDLRVSPGQIIAILGPPGSGKSTLVHLVSRFYDVTAGRITIDGVDVRDITLESLRRNVGIVLQDVFLFTATIRENIAYGALNASQEDIEEAAKAAQLHDFIMGLPQGYDTWVGERGVTLSGGQRQRLAIARTLLLDPPILILDDSTSSVDAETEQLIQKALAAVVKGRTTFVIAHRLSTVHNADIILVLDDGRIVEQGTHRELLERGGLYREVYELQLRPQEEAVHLERAPVGDGGDD